MIGIVGLCVLPFVMAGVGWCTNVIAIKMLFHPRRPVKVGLLILQGILPKRQETFAKRLGELVSDELFSISDLLNYVNKEDLQRTLLQNIELRIDALIEKKLPSDIPFIGMFLNANMKATIKNALMHEVQKMVPDIYDSFVAECTKQVNIQQIVTEKIRAFSLRDMERLVLSVMQKEFRFVERIGGLLGFVIGCVQSLIMLSGL